MPRKLWMMGVWPQGSMRNVVRMMPANFCAVGHAQLACGLCRAVVADWRSTETIQKSGLKPTDFDRRCLSAKPPIKFGQRLVWRPWEALEHSWTHQSYHVRPWLPGLQNVISRPFCLQNGGGLGYGHDLCGSSGWPGVDQSVFGCMFNNPCDIRR